MSPGKGARRCPVCGGRKLSRRPRYLAEATQADRLRASRRASFWRDTAVPWLVGGALGVLMALRPGLERPLSATITLVRLTALLVVLTSFACRILGIRATRDSVVTCRSCGNEWEELDTAEAGTPGILAKLDYWLRRG